MFSELDPELSGLDHADVWQDDASFHTATPVTPPSGVAFVLDRSVRQARSTSGKLVYVVFGSDDGNGLYYNWYVYCVILPYPLLMHLCRPSAKHYLSLYPPNKKPDNRGYASYEEADEAWAFFRRTGVVPLSPIDGGVPASLLKETPLVPAQPAIAHTASPAQQAPTSPAYRTPASPAYRTPASPTCRTPASPAPRTPASPAPRTPASPAPRAQTMQPAIQAAIAPRFFIVLVGYSPGVYIS
jgi:hypothetical protein